MNDIKLLGRLSKDPELKQSSQGKAYTWFTLAVPRQNNREQADFFRCVAFGKLAESLDKHCNKGRQLLINGRMEVSQKKDEQTQIVTTYHNVVATGIEFLHDPHRQA